MKDVTSETHIIANFEYFIFATVHGILWNPVAELE